MRTLQTIQTRFMEAGAAGLGVVTLAEGRVGDRLQTEDSAKAMVLWTTGRYGSIFDAVSRG